MRRRTLGVIIAVAVVVLAAAAIFASGILTPSSSGGSMAPTFTVNNIYGTPFDLSNYRGNSVVMIEFTALSCSECQIVEKSMASLYAQYNATGTTNVQVVSIYIEPEFGDTIPALKSYHAENNITWTMAQDTPTLAVSESYHVIDIPDVFIIDKKGEVVYDQTGAQTTSTLQTTISQSLSGKAAPITLVTVSVFGLAAIAGVTTFFSPCAFPMFPGYMSLYLGLNSASTAATPSTPSYGGAARRAAIAGSATALGMLIIFLTVGIALLLGASVVSPYIPDLLVVVGVALVALGALLLTNLQYWRIVTPLQNLWKRIRGGSSTPSEIGPAGATGGRLYLKMFSYGMGYAAAAAGCVAPVIFSAVIGGLALGLVGGLLTVLIFSATAAILMIVVTVMLAVASRRFVQQLKAATPVIKKLSAAALIVVGVYLMYYYYTAWIL